MPDRRPYLEIFLVSLGVLLLEVSYTRVFSYKLAYYFTYLIIGISLLGLGAGGVFVVMFPALRRATSPRVLPLCCLAGGVSVLVGYTVIAWTQLNAVQLIEALASGDSAVAFAEGWRLVAICVALFTPYLAAGIAIARIFSTHADAINRLYFADLVGAGLGCAISVPLMAQISPPGCVFLGGFCLAAAGLRPAMGHRALRVSVAAVAVVLLGGAALGRLPEPIPDRNKTMSPQKQGALVVYSRWDPVFRVDVLESFLGSKDYMMLSHDGMWGSVLPRWDGDPASLAKYDSEERSIPFRLLAPGPRVAIIGAAGGNEILASLRFDASHVTAVELNPVTVGLLRDRYADWVGRVAFHPRVDLVNAEGRSFLATTSERFDLIWFVAPDSYAAMNAAMSGAFVLSESYLYTAEMVEESVAHLTAGGIICVQFGENNFDGKPNRTARYLATAREAFRRLGVTDFERHVLVATTPGLVFTAATILLKPTPFTTDEITRFAEATAALPKARVRHAWNQPPGDNPIDKVIRLPPGDLAAWYAQHPFDVRPVTDDAPFFWHFVPFRTALRTPAKMRLFHIEEGMGERLLVLLLAVATILAAMFLLAPLLVRRAVWRAIPYKLNAAVYFAALGFGFMFLEVTLIQRLTLFLGYPTHSLTVTLFALLLSTGAGSLLSERAAGDRRRLLLVLGASLAVLWLFYQFALGPLVARGMAWSFPLRIVFAVLLLTPLGLCLGAFMPLGLRTVVALTPHREEYVAWAWAVNGFCSVVSSVLSTLLSMTFGFTVVMLAAFGIYAIGIVALLAIPEGSALQRDGLTLADAGGDHIATPGSA